MNRTHLILRAYIAAARNEHHEPKTYTDEQLKADLDEPVMSEIYWDVPVRIGKLIFEVKGYSSEEQFKRGIVEQPGRLENAIICSTLRKTFGDISDIPGFDQHGVFQRDKLNDFLVPAKENGLIVKLKGYSSRQLQKERDKL